MRWWLPSSCVSLFWYLMPDLSSFTSSWDMQVGPVTLWIIYSLQAIWYTHLLLMWQVYNTKSIAQTNKRKQTGCVWIWTHFSDQQLNNKNITACTYACTCVPACMCASTLTHKHRYGDMTVPCKIIKAMQKAFDIWLRDEDGNIFLVVW